MSNQKITREELEKHKKEFGAAIKHYRAEVDRIGKEYLQKIEKIKKDALKEVEAQGHAKDVKAAEKQLGDL